VSRLEQGNEKSGELEGKSLLKVPLPSVPEWRIQKPQLAASLLGDPLNAGRQAL